MSQNDAIKAAMAKRNPKPADLLALRRRRTRDYGGRVLQKPTVREAEAHAFVAMSREVVRALPRNPKGDPLEVARVAGVMAAKRTAELIPMCHPIPLSKVEIHAEVQKDGIAIRTLVRTTAVTGVEMEALVAASVAALTVYDMCKALDKSIEIRQVHLVRKSGGKSGD